MSKQVKFCRCDESCPIHHAPVVINAEMLEALKAIQGTFPKDRKFGFPNEFALVDAVIAKAEGKS